MIGTLLTPRHRQELSRMSPGAATLSVLHCYATVLPIT